MQFTFPILWRYLLKQYLKVLCLSSVAFISILLTIRLTDIAHFASFGASGISILKFTINQMAHIIPYAIPISCFISAIILIQRLSHTHELTALRSCGFAFKDVFTPLIIAASILSLLNFVISSEAATHANLSTNQLKEELRSINPLVLLHNKHLLKLKGIHFDTMGASRIGEYANDAILAIPNKADDRVHLMIAKTLRTDSDHFVGEGVTLITHHNSEEEQQYDKLMVENMAKTKTLTQEFAQLFHDPSVSIKNDQLRLPLLVTYIKQEKAALKNAYQNQLPESAIIKTKRNIARAYSEILRRFSAGVSVITFTLMGLAFGITNSRHHNNRRLIWAVILLAGFLMANLAAKEMKHQLFISSLLFIVPHVIILTLSILTIERTTRGIEA